MNTRWSRRRAARLLHFRTAAQSAPAQPRQCKHDLPAMPLAVAELTTGAPIGPAHNQATQYQSCTICHTDVHGSNVSAVLFHSNF